MLRKNTKKALALFLTLTMLLSCMVWSGASAATEYMCDFTNYDARNLGGSDQQNNNSGKATVVKNYDADHGDVMRLEYKQITTSPDGVGFRYYYNDGNTFTKLENLGPVPTLVEFEYKVESTGTSDITLRTMGGSINWSDIRFNTVENGTRNAILDTIAAGSGAGEWKKVNTIIYPEYNGSSAGLHVYLKSANKVNAYGTSILVDNVKVVVNYVSPTVILDYGYNDLKDTFVGITGNPVDLTAPGRSGYSFLGWYDESDNPVTSAVFGESGTTTTYVAKWEASNTTSTLKFATNGGAPMEDMLGTPGGTATVANPTKAGSKFTGWYSDSACTNKVTTITFPANQDEVATLYAGWQAIDYVVTYCDFDTMPTKSDVSKPAGYKSDGSSSGDNSDNVIYDTENGYMKFALNGKNAKGNDSSTFVFRVYGNRWQTHIDGTKVVDSTDDASRAAKGLPYRVSFKYKVNTLTVPAAINVRNGDVFIGRQDAGKDNYKGGNDDAALVGSVALAPVTEAGEWQTAHVDFVAVDDAAWQVGVAISQPTDEPCDILIDDVVVEWLPDSRRVNLVMDYNDGVTANGTLAQVAGDTVTLPTPVSARPGYAFDGWLDDAGNPVEGAITVPCYGVVYTARWREDNSQTAVIFETNGGNKIDNMFGTAGDAVVLPTPTKGLYEFAGWFYDAELTEQATEVTYPEEGAITLYARWNDPADNTCGMKPSGEYLGIMDFETGAKEDYLLKTDRVNLTTSKNHTKDGSGSATTHLVRGVNSQRDRFRLVLQPGDMATAQPLEVKAGEGYTIAFWVRLAKSTSELTFYAATLGASDVNTQINAGGGEIHLQQDVDYYAVGTTVNGNFAAKEPKALSVNADQWTYVVMHIPSIALDDASDVNYLSIGVTDGATNPNNTAFTESDLYVDDISIWRDYQPTGNLIASMDFEDSAISDYIYKTKPGNTGSSAAIVTDANRGSSFKTTMVPPYNTQRVRPRLVLEKDGAPLVVEKDKSYTISFWLRTNDKNMGTLALYAATMGSSDVNSQINAESSCHTLQRVSYCSTGLPMSGGGQVTWATAMEVASGWLNANSWTQIVMTLPAVTLDAEGEDNYLALGYTVGGGGVEPTTSLYIDDIKVYDNTLTSGMELLNSVNTVEQYVGGNAGKLPEGATATEGSAVYDDNGTEKTAFRVSATYKVGEDFNEITIDGKVYDIVERGILLGSAKKVIANGGALTLSSTAATGLVGKVSATTNLDKYWRFDEATGTVTYSALVRGITKEIKDTRFVARSYMKILVDGNEVVLYSKLSHSFTAQSIYDSACNVSETAYGWFE